MQPRKDSALIWLKGYGDDDDEEGEVQCCADARVDSKRTE